MVGRWILSGRLEQGTHFLDGSFWQPPVGAGTSGIGWLTALEDLGIHEIGTLTHIAAAIERRRFGHRTDEWSIIAQLVVKSSAGSRCQAANDLYNLALNDNRYDRFRAASSKMLTTDLLEYAGDPARDLIERGIAVLSLMGSAHAPWVLTRQVVEPEAIIAAVGRDQSAAYRALYGWAFRKSGLALAMMSTLLIAVEGGTVAALATTNDELPEVTSIRSVPGYAMDQYTRVGKSVIGDFVAQNGRWAEFAARQSLTKQYQRNAAGELLFRVEGAAVTRRASWDVARVLREKSLQVGCFLPEEAVPIGLQLVAQEIGHLNDLRGTRFAGAHCK